MTHRIDPDVGRGGELGARVNRRSSDAERFRTSTPVVIVSSSALVVLSLALTSLTMIGMAQLLPASLRAVVVCLVALTLPGLPIAALLRLPSNGIFASVTIALSIATNTLLAQLNFGSGVRQPAMFQLALLVITGVAIGCLVKRWNSHTPRASMTAAVRHFEIRRALTRRRGVTIALLAISFELLVVAVSRMETAGAGRFGLLQILGLDYFAGLAIVAVVLAVEYRRIAIDAPMLAITNVVLITYVTMPVAWADRTAPFSTAYTHTYISDWMVHLGTLPPPVDARISWAGFFSTAAQLMSIGGLSDADVFIVDASLVFGVLLIFPVYAIGLTISGKSKAAWLGVTVYVLFNWYQQDYFAPQAVAMQIYTTVLAVLLWQVRSADLPALAGSRWKRLTTSWMRIPGRVDGRDARWTLAMEMILVLVIGAEVVSHQLTPLVTIAALVVFAAFGMTRHKALWLAAGLIFVSWFTYGAHDYWQGHLGEIITDIGGVDQNVSSSVGKPVGDPVYGRMQYLRIAASILLFSSAALGWWRLPRGGIRPIVGALAVVPFGLILVQSYGGEVAIRCFLYASPLLAPLAALVVMPLLRGGGSGSWRQRFSCAAAVLMFFTLGVWVVTDRGLNTSFEHTTREEVSVARQIMGHVDDAGQLAYWGQGALYGLSKTFELTPDCLTGSAALAGCAAKANVNYVIDSDQDEKYLQYQLGVEPETIRDAVRILLSDKGFQMMYDGHDIRVLRRNSAPAFALGTSR